MDISLFLFEDLHVFERNLPSRRQLSEVDWLKIGSCVAILYDALSPMNESNSFVSCLLGVAGQDFKTRSTRFFVLFCFVLFCFDALDFYVCCEEILAGFYVCFLLVNGC